MPSEGDLGLKPETILELPIESLALAVLENYSYKRVESLQLVA